MFEASDLEHRKASEKTLDSSHSNIHARYATSTCFKGFRLMAKDSKSSEHPIIASTCAARFSPEVLIVKKVDRAGSVLPCSRMPAGKPF